MYGGRPKTRPWMVLVGLSHLLMITLIWLGFAWWNQKMKLAPYFRNFIRWSPLNTNLTYKFFVLIMVENLLIRNWRSTNRNMAYLTRQLALIPLSKMGLQSSKIATYLKLYERLCLELTCLPVTGVKRSVLRLTSLTCTLQLVEFLDSLWSSSFNCNCSYYFEFIT